MERDWDWGEERVQVVVRAEDSGAVLVWDWVQGGDWEWGQALVVERGLVKVQVWDWEWVQVWGLGAVQVWDLAPGRARGHVKWPDNS